MLKKAILLSVIVVSLMSSLWPSVQGKIEGVVTDSEGQPLEGVAITITSLKMSSQRVTLKTNKEGKYAQIGLWPAQYMVDFKKSGFLPASREVRVGIAETIRLDMVLEKAQELVERSLSKADSLFLKGYKLYEKGDYEEAVEAYEEAIQHNSAQWGYFFNLGLSYKKLDQKEKALEAFHKALDLNPESYSCNKEIGEILAKSGNFEEARKYYQRATELNPDEPDAFYNLGVCLINLGGSDKAIEALLRTVEIKDDYADAYYSLGTLSIGQNKTEEAVRYLEKFLQLAPEHEKADLARQLLEFLKK